MRDHRSSNAPPTRARARHRGHRGDPGHRLSHHDRKSPRGDESSHRRAAEDVAHLMKIAPTPPSAAPSAGESHAADVATEEPQLARRVSLSSLVPGFTRRFMSALEAKVQPKPSSTSALPSAMKQEGRPIPQRRSITWKSPYAQPQAVARVSYGKPDGAAGGGEARSSGHVRPQSSAALHDGAQLAARSVHETREPIDSNEALLKSIEVRRTRRSDLTAEAIIRAVETMNSPSQVLDVLRQQQKQRQWPSVVPSPASRLIQAVAEQLQQQHPQPQPPPQPPQPSQCEGKMAGKRRRRRSSSNNGGSALSVAADVENVDPNGSAQAHYHRQRTHASCERASLGVNDSLGVNVSSQSCCPDMRAQSAPLMTHGAPHAHGRRPLSRDHSREHGRQAAPARSHSAGPAHHAQSLLAFVRV